MLVPPPAHRAMNFASRVLLLALMLTATTGCMRWRQVRTLPYSEQGDVSVRTARVTTARGTSADPLPEVVVLRDARITADSVIGWREGAADRVAVHRSQVRVLESRGVDPWRTGGAVVLTILVGFGAAVGYLLSQFEV
jgi:hypothetical protein